VTKGRPLRIAIIGGGPAGLFCAGLLKRTNPEREVTVYERNPAEETYGWGLVMSKNALQVVQSADPPTHARLTSAQVTFDVVEVRIGGEAIRAGGHEYSAISRHQLLAILQQQCEARRVTCRFSNGVRSVSELAGADLIIGADGINSLARNSHQAFRHHVHVDELRYVWLAAQRPFEAMTIVARQSEYGWFQAHIYPFDRELSTCVVFCRTDTWLRAGLDHATQSQTVDICQDILAGDLDGAGLLSRDGRWRRFRTVMTDRWQHGKVVLVGDAAHTVHPTIGSGTKLALEDAAALVRALDASADVPSALKRYELERRPVADRYQRTAAASRDYCGRLESWVSLDPMQFGLQMLGRSQRLDYDELRRRDPAFIRDVEHRLAVDVARTVPALDPALERQPIQLPLNVGTHTLANRLVLDLTGRRSAPSRDELARLATDQAGAVVIDTAGLAGAGGGVALREMVRRLRGDTATKVMLRLIPERPGPSALARRAGGESPVRAADFLTGVGIAVEAGVDVLELDFNRNGAPPHGSARLRRPGRPGTAHPRKSQAVARVIAAIRAVAPSSLALAAALRCEFWDLDDPSIDAIVELGQMAKAGGCVLIHLQAHQRQHRTAWHSVDPQLAAARCGAYVRTRVGLPTMVDPGLTTPGALNMVIAAGYADLCLLKGIEATQCGR
jgi:anthraniloyl-CoA monooxygenase